MNSGATLAGNGTINVDSMALGLTSGLTYTGAITAQNATSTGATIATPANITVAKTLHLPSGALTLTAGNLGLSSGAKIEVGGGTLSTSGSGSLGLSNPYDVSYVNGSATTGAELSGSGLRNVTVNVPGSGSVNLSNDLTENGTLALNSGSLNLNGHNLTFGTSGDLAASGSGTISSTPASNIAVNTGSGLTGNMRFASGANTVNNLTMNTGSASGSASLGSDLNVDGQLGLQSGKIKLGNNNLSVATGGSITGGSANSYVVTDGSGKLTQHIGANGAATFNVGTSANYAPMTVTDASGTTSGDVSVNVANGVYANGGTSGTNLSTTQPVVDATWNVGTTASGGANYTLQPSWSTGMEVNGFNRGQSYISHNVGGTWDANAPSAATASGGMYTTSRTGVTSGGSFAVADKDAQMTTGVATVSTNNDALVLYPNPATTRLSFNTNAGIKYVNIYDMVGHMVKSEKVKDNSVFIGDLPVGSYNIRLTSADAVTTKQFVKQ